MKLYEHLPVGLLASIAFAGSFTHISDLARRSGQDGWMAYAVAVCVDALAVVASLEIRRDKRLGKKATGPTVVLAGAICLTLAANLAEAQATVWGRICAGIPAGAFLVAVALIERRGADIAQPEAVEEEPIQEPEPEPVVEPEPKAKAPKKKAKKPSAQKPPKALADLLILAREIDQKHREEHGKRISRDALRAALGVSTGTASSVLQELRTA